MESIQIQIANRSYPLNVPTDEVEAVQAAAAMVNQNLKHFQEQYGVDDPVDLLAMTALQMATKAAPKAENQATEEQVLSPQDEEKLVNLLQRMKESMVP
ncbi:MAG: cell division protein ZapA [Flavobacteriales bacterium]